MGMAKRMYEEMNDPDYIAELPGHFVSAACFEDPVLKSFVKANRTTDLCTYYQGAGKPPCGAPLHLVVRFIFDGLCTRYDDAANGVGWEGEYVGAATYDSQDLVDEHVWFSEKANPGLSGDIAGALPDRTWSETDPYRMREHEVYSYGWRGFVERVKHERRYFFGGTPAIDEEDISPDELLDLIARRCSKERMIRKLPQGIKFYRCREEKPDETFVKPRELGPAPRRVAAQNRMSPAGIPMFYGAEEQKTARAEVLKTPTVRHAMGLFALSRTVNVLDLTSSPTISIFDVKRAHLYDWALFMHQFLHDFRQRIENEDRVHIDYVPTQIVTEYFRMYMKNRKGKPIDGILYRSATKTGGKCIVLFADENDVDPTMRSEIEPDNGFVLQMLSVEQHD